MHYSKKPWTITPKPKISNSFEYFQGSIVEIQKKYEILSDIVTEYGDKSMVRNLILLQLIICS
jgi:hypothetical protein